MINYFYTNNKFYLSSSDWLSQQLFVAFDVFYFLLRCFCLISCISSFILYKFNLQHIRGPIGSSSSSSSSSFSSSRKSKLLLILYIASGVIPADYSTARSYPHYPIQSLYELPFSSIRQYTFVSRLFFNLYVDIPF